MSDVCPTLLSKTPRRPYRIVIDLTSPATAGRHFQALLSSSRASMRRPRVFDKFVTADLAMLYLRLLGGVFFPKKKCTWTFRGSVELDEPDACVTVHQVCK